MDKKLLQRLILEECGCMARNSELPASIAAAMPMLSILGYSGGMDNESPRQSHHGSYESEQGGSSFEDSDDYEESSMIKGNLYNMAQQAQEIHDIVEDGDDLPECVQEKIAVASEMLDVIYDYLHAELGQDEMHEGKKPWYMKKRKNMKKTNESEWYDIKKTKAKKKR
jgi:hypothetical protein